jgi:predicted TIM-barrel fold metal-dependent hydrolase
MVATTSTDIGIIDTDSHVTEPLDLWTSRLPKKWADYAPHAEFDEQISEQRWVVGGVVMSSKLGKEARSPRERARGTGSSLMPFLSETISHIVTSDLCHRFPRLKLVSVESGFGYVPYLMNSLDWHWKNYGCPKEYPDALLPSEYFHRQVYGTFWFETETLPLLELYADNMMFETDYPHPTSMSPGPYSAADLPSSHVEKHFGVLTPDTRRKVLHDNAAALYHVDQD